MNKWDIEALASEDEPRLRVMVAGVGGGGCRMVDGMSGLLAPAVQTLAIHTDSQFLNASECPHRLQLGAEVTHGLSTGGDTALGRRAAQGCRDRLRVLLENVDLLFLVVGLGGGTGSGAAPVVADTAREMGVLTLAFATLPFDFEGSARRSVAENGLQKLVQSADAVISVPNQRLFNLIQGQASMEKIFGKVDQTMGNCIHSIWELITLRGLINLDFADIVSLVRRSGGVCGLAYSEASGDDRVETLIAGITNSPLLDDGRVIRQAAGVVAGITGGTDLTLKTIQDVMEGLKSVTQSKANIVMGTAIRRDWRDRIALTVLASETLKPESSVEEVDLQAEEAPSTDAMAQQNNIPVSKVRAGKKARQTKLQFEPKGKGRFSDVSPTYYKGQDLDIPTYVRRGIHLSQ